MIVRIWTGLICFRTEFTVGLLQLQYRIFGIHKK